MGRGGQMAGVRTEVFDSCLRAGANLAAPGHDAVHHIDSGADAAFGLPGARGQDDGGAVGRAASNRDLLITSSSAKVPSGLTHLSLETAVIAFLSLTQISRGVARRI